MNIEFLYFTAHVVTPFIFQYFCLGACVCNKIILMQHIEEQYYVFAEPQF